MIQQKVLSCIRYYYSEQMFKSIISILDSCYKISIRGRIHTHFIVSSGCVQIP
jgi:hypothetical protein